MTAPKPVYFLLVDDMEENLLSLSALLTRDGLELLQARSGTEALELLLKYDVALALMDVQMPGMDGFELAELMRGNERSGSVPIIFLTAGNVDRQRRFRGYEAGAVDFINKPIEPDILRIKADVFFQLKRQQNLLANQRDMVRETAEENARLLAESRQYADALKEADQRKDEFLATLAHELRNPLAPIRNGLQVLRLTKSEEKAEEVRKMMDRQLTHLVRLIDDLLDVSRISRAKIELRPARIALQDAIQTALEVSLPLIEKENHELVIEVEEQDLWVDADLTRLSQIISNLLNNAAKYTPSGGKIIFKVKRDGAQVVLSITDNGIGIESRTLPHIFDLFSQVDHKSSHAQGGLGIGLFLVRRLVDLHGGTIGAASDGLGQGSTFTIILPLAIAAQPQTASSEDTGRTETPQAAKLKVLVVDDNIPSAQTIGWMLELIGHEPTLAHTGQEALDKARSLLPDVVLLDIGLPDITGYEVCGTMRKEPQFEKTLMIAQTGWGQDRDRELARQAGFNHHLVKPIKLDELSALLGNNADDPA